MRLLTRKQKFDILWLMYEFYQEVCNGKSKDFNSVFCNECGYESTKWLGKCPACNAWNTFVEEKVVKQGTSKVVSAKKADPVSLNSIENIKISRVKSGFDELDRVLGGGFVKGSLTLLGGEPGIGKSTLILQICDKIQVEEKFYMFLVKSQQSKLK